MKKMRLALFMGLFLLLGCTNNEVEPTDDASVESVNEDTTEDVVINPIDRELFNGYWGNEQFVFYIEEDVFYIQDKENLYVNSFAIADESLGEDSLSFPLGEVREEDSISVIENNREITFTLADTVLSLDGGTYQPVNEEDLQENFRYFVQTDGEVGMQAYQGPDLTLEDFKGPWMYFVAKENNHILPLGQIGLGITEDGLKQVYMESSYYIDRMVDYSISGNTLTMTLDTYDALSFDPTYSSEPIELTRYIFEASLFEEEDRDRLVTSDGEVFKRVTVEELTTTSTGMASADRFTPYPDFIENMHEEMEIYYAPFSEMSEDEYTLIIAESNNEEQNPVGYPYSSSGILTELDLYKERQIINGEIPHPEEGYDHEVASRDLINGTFENTPSYNNFDYEDRGYYFSGILADYKVGANTVEDLSQANLFEAVEIDLTDHIYTIEYIDWMNVDRTTERYFRINRDVFYKEDENGEFTERYAQNLDWAREFYNLPKSK